MAAIATSSTVETTQLKQQEDHAVRHYLAALENMGHPDPEYEAAFVGAVVGWSERRGISYRAWCEMGVPAYVLLKAGLQP